ncbi:MAG: NAD(P)-binding domain-containing protein [Woeseiaceae bacterium]|nr:NAD(P)-binding domain-containing protein [Woeseiaceae bacterium]
MKIAVLGTGMVGQALANRFLELGHNVMMGSRTASNDAAVSWAKAGGENAHHGTFEEAAAFGDTVVFATLGAALLDAAKLAGTENLEGKTVLDVTNPLDMSGGMPPTLIPELSNTTSAAEALQAMLPGANVIKALNTMNCEIMVAPSKVPGNHDVFVCGDNEAAKTQVVGLLNSMGWKDPVDLGPLAAARGTEGMMPFWLRMWSVLGTAEFNYKIQVADQGD